MDTDKTPSITRRSIMQLAGAALVLPTAPLSAQDLEERRMAFTPKFVDLVRNFTFTSGTGNLVLDDAAPGFTSFTAVLQPGDQFYYTVIGLEKTTESEVGRGTLQADGSIAREPINGAPTNFSGGRKSVALIAAAEWFESIAPAIKSVEVAVADRIALAAIEASAGLTRYLTEAGRDGIFVFDGTDRSAEVEADIRQGIYVASASDPTGASGAWIRSLGPNRVVDAAWFDLVGDGATDNHPALNSAVTVAGMAGGPKKVAVPPGLYALAQPLAIPEGVTIEGSGPDTVLVATGGSSKPWVIHQTSGSNFTVRNMKMRPSSSGMAGVYRSAISLTSCTNAKIENVIVDDVTDCTHTFLWDCDSIVYDGNYFDGGATTNNGYGVYAVGCKGCKIVNSTAIRCGMGFVLSGDEVDPESTRTTAESYGNTIANCYVRYAKLHSFNINSSTYNTISNCHAEDYNGSSTHKAFQTKDNSSYETRGNTIIGCTVKNYPAGFGGQGSAQTQYIGCTATNVSVNGFELNGCRGFNVVACAVHEFGQCGIWLGSSGRFNNFDDVLLETSTTTATGIKIDTSSGASGSCSFDNITTSSTLAKFIDIGPGAGNMRFGPGCRPNLNRIIDASGATVWPVVRSTPVFSLASTSDNAMVAGYMPRGMHVAASRFVATSDISGSPQVSAGYIGGNAGISAQQIVSGVAGTAQSLSIASAFVNYGKQMTGSCTVPGTGAGYIQFEGFPLT